MSNPAAAEPTLRPIDPKIGLMCTAADQLIPLFKIGSIDIPLARRMAMSAIEAYQPDTRADYVNVARTIAFSMAALALLGAAASSELTMAEKMRAFGRANALNRSADQSERVMMQRRRFQQANPRSDQENRWPEAPRPNAQPDVDVEVDDAILQASIAEAMKEYLMTRPPTAQSPTKPAPKAAGPAPQERRPQEAKQAASPTLSPAAIRHGVPSAGGHPGTASFKAGLLQQNALEQFQPDWNSLADKIAIKYKELERADCFQSA